MTRDLERVDRIRRSLEAERLDALVCTLTANVLMASGYWPVIGSSVAVVTREGEVALLVPEDEEPLAASEGWADSLQTFRPGSLDAIASTADIVRRDLALVNRSLGLRHGAVVGYEGAESFDPSSYAASFVYGATLPRILNDALPGVTLRDATDAIMRLRAVLTPRELASVRHACATARDAYVKTAADLCAGTSEVAVAARLRHGLADVEHDRSDGYAYCMSGPNASRAHAAFQRSTMRELAAGDLVLLHCNSYCGGFWTDITRTFAIGEPIGEWCAMGEAILDARAQSLAAIRPGVRASAVDAAARDAMTRRGFGDLFIHSTGHGVGYSAINLHARPRIHPKSDDILEAGMLFNVEPAAYKPGVGGMRHCDMVLVTASDAEVLTPFQDALDQLWLRNHM